MRVVIIGGGTAGSEVAWRLRRQDKDIEIIILEKGRYRQYSPCALPYFLSGKIKKANDIVLFSDDYYNYNNINLYLNSELKEVNTKTKELKYLDKKNNKEEKLSYDYLVLATGLKFNLPSIPGLKDQDFYCLKRLDDVQRIKKAVKKNDKAVIIGAGYVGVELADALSALGLKVSLIEGQENILPTTLDKKIANIVKEEMEAKKIEVITNSKIEKITKKQVSLKDKKINYNHLFVACGLSADLSLAKQIGLKVNKGIIVNDSLKTSKKDIYAAGDLVESVNLIDNKKVLSQLATTAVSQAKVLAQNILADKQKKESLKYKRNKVLSASVSKFNNLIFASCGVTNSYCQKNNIKTISAYYKSKDKAEYYPEAKDIFIYLVSDIKGRIIGCQIAGYNEVLGRLNMVSLAIKQGLTLKDFVNSETCYNPALSSIFDPLTITAEICLKKLKAKNAKT
ncbi:MAG TPA: FAD-dependent oxidoreductase [Patescibacteria group bacterium]|nr:FAD-dependent oxidoreductase [Patescibacteria group bacterium]